MGSAAHSSVMNTELLIGLAGFAFVTSITPGPNNLMLLSSGANFGFRRSLPHMCGISVGFAAMTLVVGLGVVGLIERVPWLQTLMLTLSASFVVYLAWRIANSRPPESGMAVGQPLNFMAAALFQWVNPKAWAMALTAVSVYAEQRSASELAVLALVFGLVNLPSVGVWTWLGRELRRCLLRPFWLRVFNIAMALLLLASMYPALMMR